MTWKKKIAGTAAMFILGFIFILPVLWIVMNSIKTSPEIAADFLALPKSLYLDNFKNAMESMNFLVALKNSVVITLGAMLGGLFQKLTVLPAQKYKYTVPAAQEGNNIFSVFCIKCPTCFLPPYIAGGLLKVRLFSCVFILLQAF